ncbi:DNA polymerase I [Helicovermis profundi]|uniref:DNA polymerase I n=1 Tax=Helicovermis profundi TaxID=3065157 RepID=A0AAU9EM61_9FIRM|nr:DNA polymerase I [Clostridia bacterium S502]
MKDKVIIIDGNSLINRAFFAIPSLSNKEGIPTNGMYGFLNMLFKLLDKHSPKYVSVAFDLKAPTFRHKLSSDYKGTRKGMPDDLRPQMNMLKEILDNLGINRMELEGFEADDLIGSVAKLCGRENLDVMIFTGDKDALQLVDDNITVYITKRGITNLKEYREEDVFEEFTLMPNQIIDYKGLSGDTSDNIPGIPGVGPKTAIKLLLEFTTVENLILNSEKVKNKRIRGLVEEYKEQALLSKKLATIVTNIPFEFNVDELLIKEKNIEKLIELYKKYEFTSFIRNLKEESLHLTNTTSEDEINNNLVEEEEIEFKLINNLNELSNMVSEIKKNKVISIKSIYDKANIRTNEAIGFAISDKDTTYYVDLLGEVKFIDLKVILEDENIKKITYNGKREFLIAFRYGISIENHTFDGFIANYLINPSRNKYELSDVAMEYLSKAIKSKEDLLGKGAKAKKYCDISFSDLSNYSAVYSRILFEVHCELDKKLIELNLSELFIDVEIPLVEILASTEYEGFKVDESVLNEIDEDLTNKLREIESEIYSYSNEKFNINSPKQLGVVLFETLELPVIKKTKTGFSTSHDVLIKLEKKHPIVPLVIEYRTYSKLKSTYVDGIRSVINKETGKVHSSLNQTVAVTGRLSSSDPNMQNIPVRIPIGRKIRKVFVADNNCKLIDADYSQIELRVLAHMSKDENLLLAYRENLDIHTMTASKVFNIPLDEITADIRSRAKEVNFGIVYGMSDYGLSETLKIPRKTAKLYIEQYFEKYPGVKEYMDTTIKECKEIGYVVTLLNRRRYIPEINHKNFNLRSFAERTAMNTPIQGSAADIIKIAMINVYNRLKREKLKSKLILQVHDELIIDTSEDEIEIVKEILVDEMENAYKLDIPLLVDMKVGTSWFDTK